MYLNYEMFFPVLSIITLSVLYNRSIKILSICHSIVVIVVDDWTTRNNIIESLKKLIKLSVNKN